jgi:hypothetical protein
MMHGQVLSRDAFLELCGKNNAPKTLVDTFRNDQPGNNTVQMIIICESFFRLIWFQFPEAELERARSKKPSASSLVRTIYLLFLTVIHVFFQGADYWDDGLKDAINAGDRKLRLNIYMHCSSNRAFPTQRQIFKTNF